MIGQNSFSNANNNTNTAIFSGGKSSASTPNQPSGVASANDASAKTTGNKVNFKNILIALGALVVVAGAVVAVVLLLKNKPTQGQGEETVIYNSSPDNDGTQTSQETLNEFDKSIASATTEEEKFGMQLNKIGYYIITGDYASALSDLNSFDINSMSDFDQCRIYNYYTSLYEAQGDTAKVEQYKKLADEALARDFANS
ncbi:hypothetical protein IK146_03785 [Candidatus Saccharibacteria bacterium]|nr:hypothetical protein [Candidatus Saccharibacteria bacterium]